jgi:hypothetical protein
MKSTLSQVTLSAAIALLLGVAPSPGNVWVSYTGEGTSPNDDADGPAEDMFIGDGAQNGAFSGGATTVNTPTKFGSGAYDFQQSSAVMTVPGSSSLGTAFTLAAFAWSNSGGGEQAIFASWPGTGADDRFLLDIDPQGSANAMRFIHGTGSVSGNANFPTGQYNHFALTYDNGDVNLYLDASVIGSGNVGAGSMDLAADVTVGWSSNNRLVGWMDDILILDRVLTLDELEDHRDFGNSAIAVPESSSVALLGIGALVLGWARRRRSSTRK